MENSGTFSLLDLDIFDDEPVPKLREEKPKKNILTPLPTAYRHLMVTPLVEIYSVSIHSNHTYEGEKKCEIHGHIHVVDKFGDTFDLFLRDNDEPECIDFDGTLLLSCPSLASNGGVNAIVPSKDVSVEVLLFDKARNDMLIAEGEFTLDRTLIDCKGERVCKHVQGDDGFARVHYAIFPYAVVATVDVLYFSEDDDFDRLNKDVKVPEIFESDYDSDGGFRDESFDEADYIDYDRRILGSSVANVFGTVTACSDMVFHGSSDEIDYFNSSVLFRKSSEQSVQLRSGDFIQLSRSIVAMPAYSSLKIEVDLFKGDTQLPIGRSTVEFSPLDSRTFKEDIVGDNGRIRVRVKWSEGYHQLNRASTLKRTYEIGNVEQMKRQKLLLEQQSPSTLCSIGMPSAMPSKYYDEPVPIIEVFSVVVCAKDFEPFSFYGKIHASTSVACIFDRNANCPQQCPALGTHVELDCHCSFSAMDDFSIWVNLKDVNRCSISKGHIGIRAFTLDWQKKWLNRRLCAIIRGDRGFAAVHYAIFYDALAAKVDVELSGNTPSSRVCGKIVACYGTHAYMSSYEKEYYQSVLFRKDAKEVLTLETSSIPLLKSVLAVPKNSSLIFEADLTVSPVNVDGSKLPQQTESLRGNIELKLSAGGEFSGQIIGRNVHIVVSVKCRYSLY